jgi:hypothetical protein
MSFPEPSLCYCLAQAVRPRGPHGAPSGKSTRGFVLCQPLSDGVGIPGSSNFLSDGSLNSDYQTREPQADKQAGHGRHLIQLLENAGALLFCPRKQRASRLSMARKEIFS